MKLLKMLEKILPLLFWSLLIFAFDTPNFACLTIIAALIHELGHMIFGATRGVIRLLPSPHATGFRITPGKTVSYKDEIILLLGGPVLNFLFFFLAIFILKFTKNSYFFDFAFFNLITALSNLLPIKGYDGYRIIENLILLRTLDSSSALSLLSHFSFLFTASLMFISLYLLLKLGEGYWIFVLFFTSVALDIKKVSERGTF